VAFREGLNRGDPILRRNRPDGNGSRADGYRGRTGTEAGPYRTSLVGTALRGGPIPQNNVALRQAARDNVRKILTWAGYSTVADHATTSTRSSLLLRVRDPRDHEAWTTFVELYGRLVYSHCRNRGLGHQDAENVTQEVFAQVCQSIQKFDYQPERGRFRNWMGTVTRNEINRFLKKEARVGCGADDGVLDNLAAPEEDTVWTDEFHAHVFTVALARTRPHFEELTWRAFELAWLEGRPAAEVALELGVPIEKVYVAKSRVLERLEGEVRELAEDAIVS